MSRPGGEFAWLGDWPAPGCPGEAALRGKEKEKQGEGVWSLLRVQGTGPSPLILPRCMTARDEDNLCKPWIFVFIKLKICSHYKILGFCC